MRLEPEEIAAIKAAARQAFGPDAVVRLFGSRADDARRGGDIDLHVEIAPDIDAWKARSVFENSLFARMEEQRIDVIIKRRGEAALGIDLIAHRDGVLL